MKLFNKGIYKSTLRRFAWGSVFYFVILFLITGIPILMNETPSMEAESVDIHILLRYGEYLFPSVIIGVGVATITAMLVYRFVHSKKQTVFTHALPVTREENFISTALAGLTLMVAPITLNALVLAVMTFIGYGYLFTFGECMVWMGVNLLCVFVMFAYATFSAMLTGNTFAVAVLNFLLHIVFATVALGFSSIATAFLYGYGDSNTLLTFVADNNPVVWMLSVADNVSGREMSFDVSKAVFQTLAALILYVLSLILYKKRRMETAEDVAAFNVLNFIFKYFLTFIAALGAFGVFMSMGKNAQTIIAASLIVGALAYFGSEMALKKTLKVWRAYKGYLGFVAVYALMIAVSAFTSVFGYETRVPAAEEIAEVAVYQYYYQWAEPFLDNDEIEKYALKLHEEILAGEDADEKWCAGDERQTNIHIKYKLKNGSVIHRRYGIDNDKKREIMNELYKHDDYKMANEELFKDEIKEIRGITINHGEDINGDFNELLECVRKDILALDYNQMRMDYTEHWSVSLSFEYLIEGENEHTATLVTRPYEPNSGILGRVYTGINANYKNTIAWLKANGYWNRLTTIPTDGAWYICEDDLGGIKREEQRYADIASGMEYSMKEEMYSDYERFTPLYKLTGTENLTKAAEFIYNYEICENDDSKYYTIVCIKDGGELKQGYTILTNIDEFTAKALINEVNAEFVG